MQHPTLTDVRIQSVEDAELIFEAVRRGKLRMCTDRLSEQEREAIRSGDVYVWPERTKSRDVLAGGIERWTDGMTWGPSRVRDEFLFYHEGENQSSAISGNVYAHYGSQLYQTPIGYFPQKFIKQTYSVWVYDRENGVPNKIKWHLTAYYKQVGSDMLDRVRGHPALAGIHVLPGSYPCARSSTSRSYAANQREVQRVHHRRQEQAMTHIEAPIPEYAAGPSGSYTTRHYAASDGSTPSPDPFLPAAEARVPRSSAGSFASSSAQRYNLPTPTHTQQHLHAMDTWALNRFHAF